MTRCPLFCKEPVVLYMVQPGSAFSGGYRLCFINVMLAQFGLSCAYTRTVANTLQQIWDIPSQELYVLLGVLLCLQNLGPN